MRLLGSWVGVWILWSYAYWVSVVFGGYCIIILCTGLCRLDITTSSTQLGANFDGIDSASELISTKRMGTLFGSLSEGLEYRKAWTQPLSQTFESWRRRYRESKYLGTPAIDSITCDCACVEQGDLFTRVRLL
jgi:hypothetical protein